MTELTYEVPTVGEKHQASDQRVSTALTEIKSVLNGRLTAGNFPSEIIIPKKFAKPEAWKLLEGSIPELKTGETTTLTGAGNPLTIILTLILGAVESTVAVEVGSILIARTRGKGITTTIGPFRWPANEALVVECRAGSVSGSIGELKGGLL